MDKIPPPLPVVRREPLLRGLLVLTALGRVLMIPFYLICALGSSIDLKIFYPRPFDYVETYIADLVLLAMGMWTLLLLSVLLAWLFFSRHRMFRPLMIYFSFLPPLVLVGVGMHMERFRSHPRTHPSQSFYANCFACTVLFAIVFWPFYYIFSPRVKRVFTR